MNEASEWRLTLARKVARAYAGHPKVAAVLVGGSVSRGCADRYSDLEIGVMWHEAPTDEERLAAARTFGGEVHRIWPFDVEEESWADDIFLGRVSPDQPGTGLLVEMVHHTVEYTERAIADVLERCDTSELKQALLAALVTAIPLHGEALLESWRTRALAYPGGLAVAMVKKHAQIDHFWRTEMYLERGNNLLLLYDTFVQISKKLVCLLLALNHVYYTGFSGFKWIDMYLGTLRIAPAGFGPRLKGLFQAEPRTAIEEMRSLVEETYDLIEEYMPEVDIRNIRRIFRYRRQPWDEAPVLTGEL